MKIKKNKGYRCIELKFSFSNDIIMKKEEYVQKTLRKCSENSI